MTSGIVVSNASPLIALAQIGQLELLEALFGTISIPPSVAKEISPTIKSLPSWIEQRGLRQDIGPQILAHSLGPGESEAISLAIETGATWVILDERRARRLARSLKLSIVGTLGILITAKERGLIADVRAHLDALEHHHFHIANNLYDQVLIAANEAKEIVDE